VTLTPLVAGNSFLLEVALSAFPSLCHVVAGDKNELTCVKQLAKLLKLFRHVCVTHVFC
jgi:hypothetical protein